MFMAVWFVLCDEFHKCYCKKQTTKQRKKQQHPNTCVSLTSVSLYGCLVCAVWCWCWCSVLPASAACSRVFQFTQCHQDVRGSPQGQLCHDPTEAVRRSVPSSPTVLWGWVSLTWLPAQSEHSGCEVLWGGGGWGGGWRGEWMSYL